jgi:hypothetical protein
MSAAADPLAGIGAAVGGAPPPASGSDPLAGLGNPVGATASSPAPAPTGLADNPKGEGTYQMQGPSGNLAVPYSKVKTASEQHGYNLAEADAPRYAKDAANDPLQQLKDLNTGFTGALSQTGRTAEKAITHLPILGKILANSKGFQESEAADEARATAPNDTPAKMSGAAIENILEFASGDEALKGLTYSEKLMKLAPVAKLMEKSPYLAKALDTAIRSGIVGTGQAGAHGADAETAAATGVLTGAGAGLLEGGLGAVGAFAKRTAPAVENIAGENVQTLASQRPGTGPRGDVGVSEVPKVGTAQQAAAPRVFKNLAQRATHDALEEANQGRVVAGQITDPARMLPAPAETRPYAFTIEGPGATSEDVAGGTEPRKRQIGTQYVAGKGSGTAPKTEPYNEGAFKYGDNEPLAPVNDQEPFQGPTHKEPVFQYLTDLKPGQEAGSTKVTGGGDLVAADPETAQAHLSRLNDLVNHPPEGATPGQMGAIEEARDSLQEQMDMYHSYQRTLPNFNPLDSARAAEGVGHFGDAADQVQNAAKPIYQKFDEATDGQFADLNRARTAAGKRGDFTAKHDYEHQIDQLIDQTPGISRSDRLQATKLWNKSKVLDGLNDVVNAAANVDDKYASQVTGGRVLSGVRMRNGMQQLIKRYGADRLESVIGKDGMENMTRISDLLNSPKAAQGFKGMSMSVLHNIMHGKVGGFAGAFLGHHLGGYEGGVAGAYAGAKAERWMLQMAATSPRVGKLLDYAVRNNVTPKVAAAGISAAMIQESQPEKPATPPPEKSGEKKPLTMLSDEADDSAPANNTNVDTNATPQAQADAAIANTPAPVQQAYHAVDPAVVQGQPLSGRGGNAADASVDQGAGNNTIEINDPASFQRHPASTTAHELVHTWQNNLPPSVQAKIPEDAEDMSAFNISDADKLRAQGHTLATIPREKAATIVQKYIEDPKKNANLKPWVDDMGKTALSSTLPTAPNATRLNMTPRSPGVPGADVAGMEALYTPSHKTKGKR